MADNKVLIELQVIQKGDSLSIIQKDTDKLAKTQDNLDKKQKKVGKSSETVIKGQKGIHQANLSSSKGFSKMNQMLDGGGGSSGLVAAYATLAANVFAATAAFNAFRGAAAFQQLGEGFTFMANQAGRTMDLVVERLKEVSGEALSTEQALQGASLAISAGFSTDDLEKLTKVAKGASLALGRNLSDAFDRLTRGAIKLEPEILDELGIMVRLDDATDAYAASIGKTSDQLTQFQRQQAFVNAINEQGIEKYGELADAVDVNPYDQLAAAFNDLTVKGLGLINVVFIPIAKIFAGSSSAMIGGLMLFGSTILTTMIPALGNMAKSSAETASRLSDLATAQASAVDIDVTKAQAVIGMDRKRSKTVKDLNQTILEGGDVQKQALITEKNLKKQLATADRQYAAASTAGDSAKMATAEARQAQIQEEIAATTVLAGADTARLTAAVGAEKARLIATQARIMADLTATAAQVGIIAGLRLATAATYEYAASIVVANGATLTFAATWGKLVKGLRVAAFAVKAFSVILLGAIPGIAQLLLLIGAVTVAYTYFTKNTNGQSKSSETLAKITETLNEKFTQLNTTIDNMGMSATKGDKRIRQLKMSAGVLLETAGAIEGVRREAEKQVQLEKDRPLSALENVFGTRRAARESGTQDAFDTKTGEGNKKQILSDGLASTKTALKGIAEDTSFASQAMKDELLKQINLKFKGEDVTESGLVAFIDSLQPKDFDNIADSVQNASTIIGNADKALTNLRKGLSEGEQVMSKFFQKAAKSTQFDGMVDTFNGFNDSIKELADEPDAIKDLFEGAGSQLKKFMTAEERLDKKGGMAKFIARMPTLGAAFVSLQKKTQTLQVDLKKLNIESKSLQSVSNLSAAGMGAFLEKTNEAVNKTIELNQEQIKTYDGVAKTPEILDEIKRLKTENLGLEQKLLNATQIQIQESITALTIEKQKLDINRKNAVLAEKNTVIQAKIAALSIGGKVDPAREQRDKVTAARSSTEFAKKTAEIEKNMIEAKQQAYEEEIAAKLRADTLSAKAWYASLLASREKAKLDVETSAAVLANTIENNKLIETQGMASDDPMTIAKTLMDNTSGTLDNMASRMVLVNAQFKPLIASFRELGAEGEGIATAMEKMLEFTSTLFSLNETIEKLTKNIQDLGDMPDFVTNMGIDAAAIANFVGKAQAISQMIGTIGALQKANTDMRVAAIDREIAAEKRMDGNSRASLGKIDAMEKKKMAVRKKAFEEDKKIKVAQAIIAGLTGAAMAFASLAWIPVVGPALGAAVAASIMGLTAKNVSMIQATQFDGGGAVGGGAPQSISVGSRANSVDISQGVTGGENSFLRGNQGVGSNANNFAPGGAAGMRKGYAAGGEVLVGEQGPEVMQVPTSGFNITPGDAKGGTTNANFTINAVDAAGVEEVLTAQRANIINMIREAAHEHGEEFIEGVNTSSYGGG